MRRLSPLLTVLAALLTFATSPLGAEYLYMGGPRPFTPFSDSTSLAIAPGSACLMDISPVRDGGETRLSAIMNVTTLAREGAGFAIAAASDTIGITFREELSTDHVYDNDRLQLSFDGTCLHSPQTIFLTATPDQYHLGKDIALTLILTPAPNSRTKATLKGGRTQMHELWSTDTLPLDYTSISAIGFTSTPGTSLTVRRAILSIDGHTDNSGAVSREEIERRLRAASDPYAGYWTILDYTLEDSMLRPGGEYLLALLPSADGGYDIVYLEGATINPGRWTPGRHKGHLAPTRLSGLYRVNWTDAEGQSLDHAATLQFTGTDMARLIMPTLRSEIRLHRVRT